MHFQNALNNSINLSVKDSHSLKKATDVAARRNKIVNCIEFSEGKIESDKEKSLVNTFNPTTSAMN